MKGVAAAHIPGAYPLTQAVHLPVVGDDHPLRREFTRWLTWANGATLLAGLLVYFVWFLLNQGRTEEAPTYREVKIARYTELGVPPSISRAASTAPQVSIAQAVAPPSIGIPEPVPDVEVPETATIATQEEMAAGPVSIGDLGGTGTGDSLAIGGGGGGEGGEGEGDGEPSPDEFIAVEVEPVRISIAQPDYPAVARSAGVEGTVIVRALIGKDGRVKKCLILDGQPMLNDAAVECARTALFKPALLQNKPVEVWVMMPITFQLRQR
jgi:protein TonB